MRTRKQRIAIATRAAAPAGARSRARGERGFALLITLTMVAFVVLLLIGLASYTRIETAVAGNMQRQAQARENALLALNVALDQLQKHAGDDRRVTATAEAYPNVDPQKRFYTGVWNTTDPVAPTPPAEGETPPEPTAVAPRAWLASGAETSGVDVTATIPTARRVTLLGGKTDGSSAAQAVTAELQDITVPGAAGITGTAVVGRYAYWVGDQGVKAPVGFAAKADAVNYAPFVDGTAGDLRARIQQQIALGAGAATASGETAFEPRDANNASLIAGEKIFASSQLAFLRDGNNTALGLAALRQNYHAWSVNNFAVIADTKRGGLRQDLSLKPDLLGSAFVRWASYTEYMEKFRPDAPAESGSGGETTGTETPPVVVPAVPDTSALPQILPAYGEDPLRRRYVMTPHTSLNTGGSHQVGPVLADFCLAFNVRTVNESAAANAPIEIRAVWMLSLWNPYTSSLVPEDLRVEIAGLPTTAELLDSGDALVGTIPVAASFAANSRSPLRASLPWASVEMPSDVPLEDRQSWLPGRVYTWRSIEDISKGAIPADGYASRFYTRSFTADGETNGGVQRDIPGITVDGGNDYRLRVLGGEPLTITIYAVRAGQPVRLGQFSSPRFQPDFVTSAQTIKQNTFQFAYVFRLKESVDVTTNPGEWLTSPNIDFRRWSVPGEAYFLDNGDSPAVYAAELGSLMTERHNRLLFRSGVGRSYNEDVPLFELPRGPLLSVGQLQHFRITNSRPFMIGNPWGAGAALNGIGLGQIFDRFFFSGLVPGAIPVADATGDLVLPNRLMKPLRKADGAKPTIDEIRAVALDVVVEIPTDTTPTDGTTTPTETTETPTNPAPVPATGRSSKFFVQGGAFNLNSMNATAWASVLRSVRFPSPQEFTYLDPSTESGTGGDNARARMSSDDERVAHFFRFSQSAQETYKAEPDQSGDPAGAQPPTHLFRQGMRTLTAAQVSALAAKIVELMKLKFGSTDPLVGGPFRSLEEFLAPHAIFAGADADGNALAPRSLLEAAIADAGVNVDAAGAPLEFSSQYLTQADIMTALAPILFPRSDTFVIRTHGQAVNPATGAVEGRAWCEATVQRLPEYVDATEDAGKLPDELTSEVNKLHGRRFKVVAFRWLTLSDI